MKNEDIDESKLKNGDYCHKGHPACFCAVGYPYERMCPGCRDTRLEGDNRDYCVCVMGLDVVICYRCGDGWEPCEKNDWNFTFCFVCSDTVLKEGAKEWTFMKFAHGHKEKGLWWFRLFGYGIHAKDTRIHGLMFSERNGYRKRLVLGNWSFRWLTKGKGL